MDFTSDEAIEFVKLNVGVVQMFRTSINPYYLGLKMFEAIEERYNNPIEEMNRSGVDSGAGREKIFEVREMESDSSFLRNYLHKDLVMREDMYLFQKQDKDCKTVDKGWEQVRDQLVRMGVNGAGE
ncbi:SpoVR family protein [Bacillus sp. 165]|nr:SpoVR family protein [Bacillus sp. 165]